MGTWLKLRMTPWGVWFVEGKGEPEPYLEAWLNRQPRPDTHQMEKEQIPKGTRFKVTRDIETAGLIHWRAPFTSGFHCVIPNGTILVTFGDCPASSAAFAVVPEDYRQFERQHIPPEDVSAEKYSGYSFVFVRSRIGKDLTPI